jgi:hypothetical protein
VVTGSSDNLKAKPEKVRDLGHSSPADFKLHLSHFRVAMKFRWGL